MAYWILSLALVAFGFIGMLSIGRPFLLVGLALLLLGRWRHRPAIFWPPLLAMVAHTVVYWATVPFSCTATQSVGEGGMVGVATTICSNLMGTTWSGLGIFNPSVAPARQAAVAAAGLAFVGAVLVVRAMRRNRGTSPS